jgi:hypothetical protein
VLISTLEVLAVNLIPIGSRFGRMSVELRLVEDYICVGRVGTCRDGDESL